MNPFAPIRGLFNRFVSKSVACKRSRSVYTRRRLGVEVLEDRTVPATVDIFQVAGLPADQQVVRIAHVEATDEWKVVTSQTTEDGFETAYMYTLDVNTRTLSDAISLGEGESVYSGRFSPDGRYLPVTIVGVSAPGIGAYAKLFDTVTNAYAMQGEIILHPTAPYPDLFFTQSSNDGVVAGTSNGLLYATYTDLDGVTYQLLLPEDGGVSEGVNANTTRFVGVAVVDFVVQPFYADRTGQDDYTVTIFEASSGLGGVIFAVPETSLAFAGGASGGLVSEIAGVVDHATVYDLTLNTDFQVTNSSGNTIRQSGFSHVFDTGLFGGSGLEEGVFVYHYLSSTDHWDHTLTFDEYLSSLGTTWTYNEDTLADVEQSGGTTAWVVREGNQSIFVFISDEVVTDTTAPETTITEAPALLTASTSATFVFGGSDDTTPANALSYEYRLDGGSWTANNGSLSVSGFIDGAHLLEVRAQDQAANTDSTPASFSWTVDTSGPSIAISHPSTTASSGDPVSFTITYSDPHFGVATLTPADIILHRTGSANGSVAVTAINPASFFVTISNLSGNGTLALSVHEGSAQDTLGNQALAAGPSAPVTVAVAPPPQPVLILNAQRTDRILTVDVTGRTSGVIVNDYPGNHSLTVHVVGIAARPIDVTIQAGAGNDTVLVQANNVRILGDLGAGNDRLWIVPVAFAQASVHLGAGNDVAFGGSLADQIWGDAGNDLLLGGAGDDELWGGAGNDLLLGGLGSDRYNGGEGADLFVGFDDGDVSIGFERRDRQARQAPIRRLAALEAIFRNLANRR